MNGRAPPAIDKLSVDSATVNKQLVDHPEIDGRLVD
jgi:hypothetical protein